jgi:hypothetical protein
MAQNESAHQSNQQSPVRRTPLFFREENAGFIARGNFMTLALKPQLVEEGEWLAHQGKIYVALMLMQTQTDIIQCLSSSVSLAACSGLSRKWTLPEALPFAKVQQTNPR